MKRKKNKIDENFFSKRNFRAAIDYVKESTNYIYFGIIVFFLFGIAGFVFSDYLGFLNEQLKKIFLEAQDKTGVSLFLFIFVNNLSVAFYNVVFGFVLGIFPFFNSAVNGGILGYVFSLVYSVSGTSDFWRILPHGIFELPAIFIAIGMGLKNGMFIFSKNMKEEFKRRFFGSLRVLVFVILPLLFAAGVIETLLISFAN